MFDVVDTSWLQFESVKRFAAGIGREYDEKTHSFILNIKPYPKEYESFEDAQAVHNLVKSDNKLVEKSTLQYHKKLKKFVAQKQLVKLEK